jgi:hypothetical protein
MKAYLNRLEKDQALAIAANISFLERQADQWKKIGRRKAAALALLAARALHRLLRFIFTGIENQIKVQVWEESKKMETVVKYTDQPSGNMRQ